MKRGLGLLAAAIALAVGSCFLPGEPTAGLGDQYPTWYEEVEACSGLHRDFNTIAWSIHEHPDRAGSGGNVVGHWDPPNRIWIARAYLENRGVVKHEMLHYLIGHAGHPQPPFYLCTEGV